MEARDRVADLQFPGLDNRGQPYISPHTRIGLTIYPQRPEDNGFLEHRGEGEIYFGWDKETTQGTVISFNWNKHMGVPDGTWTAVVKQRIDPFSGLPYVIFLDQEIVDGDWADLMVLRNGIVIPLCRGVVDTVRENKVAMDGATVIFYTITGRDHGAVFNYPITYSDLWAQTLGELVTGLFTQRAKNKIGGSPEQMFQLLIDGALSMGRVSGQWELPPSLKEITGQEHFYDLLKVVTFSSEKHGTGLRGAYFNELQLWTVGGQTLHQTLINWTNQILNEVWYDLLPPAAFMPTHGLGAFLKAKDIEYGKIPTDPSQIRFSADGFLIGRETARQQKLSSDKDFGTMAAFIRENPFISTINGRDSMWFDLPTWVIPTWLIEMSDLGWGGNQRSNLYELIADFGMGPQPDQQSLGRPKWNKEDIKRRGMRTYQQKTQFHSRGDGSLGRFYKEDRLIWQQLLIDWFAPAPYLRQGSIRIKVMLPEVRIGHKIVIVPNDNPDQAEQFYVEGVQHDFSSSQDGRTPLDCSTSLILTRGYKGTDEDLYKATKTLSEKFTEVL